MVEEVNKIALGTVQFGLNYGISNTKGQVDSEEVKTILKVCQKQQINVLDTAAAYGKSEEVLGLCLPSVEFNFKIISKLPKIDAQAVQDIFFRSLQNLRVRSLYGYLIHDFAAYKAQPAVYDELLKLREQGHIQKVGFSLYHPAQLEKLFLQNTPLQLVQIPFSIFDQRFAYLFKELEDRKIEIHVRSVFLQGLFFKKTNELSSFFNPIKNHLEKLSQVVKKSEVPLSHLLLTFAHSYSEISKIVIGVTSAAEFKTNLVYLDYLLKAKAFLPELKELSVTDENMILPYNWKIK